MGKVQAQHYVQKGMVFIGPPARSMTSTPHAPHRNVLEPADIRVTCSEITDKQPIAIMDFSHGKTEMQPHRGAERRHKLPGFQLVPVCESNFRSLRFSSKVV